MHESKTVLIARAKEAVGELPEAKRVLFMKEYSLFSFDVETLTATRELALWFEEAAKKSKSPKRAANFILTELLAVLNEKQETIDSVSITPLHIAELANALKSDTITSKQGKVVFEKMLATKKLPSEIIKKEGMEQINDTGAIEKIVESVLAANPQTVADFKNGKTNALGWLMGQVMKESHGKANPKQATELLKERLS